MARQTRRRVLTGVGGGAAAALVGGSGIATAHEDEDDDRGDDAADDGQDAMDDFAALNVVHASPDAPSVDVYVNGAGVLQDVPFGAVSGSLVLGVGSYRIQVTPAGESPDAAVIDATLELGAASYTVGAIGEVTEGSERPIEPLVLTDNVSPLPDGVSRVRFVHASPDAPSVDIVPAGSDDPLFSNVSYGQIQTKHVPEGDYTLEVRPAGAEDVVAEFPVSLAAGWVYSAWAVGYAAPEEAPADVPLDLLLAVDAGTPLPEESGSH